MTDGLDSWCRKCNALGSRKWREAGGKSKVGKGLRRKWRKKYLSKPENRKKHLARTRVNNAIKLGKIKRPDRCENCDNDVGFASDGRTLLRADHYKGYDEENWYNVKFICSKCDGMQLRKYTNDGILLLDGVT